MNSMHLSMQHYSDHAVSFGEEYFDFTSDSTFNPDLADPFFLSGQQQQLERLDTPLETSRPCAMGMETNASCLVDMGYQFHKEDVIGFPGDSLTPPAKEILVLTGPSSFGMSGKADKAESTSSSKSQDSSRRYKCAECKALFDKSLELEAHAISLKHQSYRCKEPGCLSTFPRRDTRRRHMKSHEIGKPHTCNVCGRHFARKDKLRDHGFKLHKQGIPAKQRGPRKLSALSPVSDVTLSPMPVMQDIHNIAFEESPAAAPKSDDDLSGLESIVEPLRSALPDTEDSRELLCNVQSSIGELNREQTKDLAHMLADLAIVKSVACRSRCRTENCKRCEAKRRFKKIEEDIRDCRQHLETRPRSAASSSS